jgi:ribose-phosphate pyrophosphokinase
MNMRGIIKMINDLNLITLKKLGEEIILFPGTSHPDLAKRIADILQLNLGRVNIDKFYNGDMKVQLKDNVRMLDVYILQTATCTPGYSVNDYIWELCMMADAALRASAKSVSAVMPNYAYSQQDKKTDGREPISAKIVAVVLKAIGVSRFITLDIHAPAIQGFVDGPFDPLFAIRWLFQALKHFLKNNINDNKYICLGPDSGAISRNKWLSEYGGLDLAFGYKTRKGKDMPEVQTILGDIKDKICLVVDDKISSGRTLIDLTRLAVSKFGAVEIIPVVAHPSPQTEALENILNTDNINILVLSNTLPIDPKIKIPPEKKLIVVDIAPLLAFAIRANQTVRGSISQLYNLEPFELGLNYQIYSNEGIKEVATIAEMSLAVN